MTLIILDIIIALLVFLATNYGAFLLFEKSSWPPKFLSYKPFSCQTCFTFWTQIGIAVALALVEIPIAAVILAALAVLNAIARKIDEKEKTININDFKKLEER